jgi:hypothetical protein
MIKRFYLKLIYFAARKLFSIAFQWIIIGSKQEVRRKLGSPRLMYLESSRDENGEHETKSK